ncbi:MAG: EamA family transporter [Synergistaceae bacterium]|nr:EamA family transporter [Synergistaceae bacterium]
MILDKVNLFVKNQDLTPILGTIFGSSKWSGLLSRYPAGRVAPFSLLIPLTSLVLARVILQEQLSPLQYLGSLVVIVGLCIINFRGALRPRAV